jgi:putative membrane protein
MNTILLILHLLGFGAAFAASLANNVVMILAAKAPQEEATGLRRFPPVMIRFADFGLVFLWVTGPILLWSKYGGADGIAELPHAFWAKIVCVVLLTGVLGMIHMALGKIKRGDMSAAAKLPNYGRIGLGLLLLIVIFATMTFD